MLESLNNVFRKLLPSTITNPTKDKYVGVYDMSRIGMRLYWVSKDVLNPNIEKATVFDSISEAETAIGEHDLLRGVTIEVLNGED
jgi:hypothetical protein